MASSRTCVVCGGPIPKSHFGDCDTRQCELNRDGALAERERVKDIIVDALECDDPDNPCEPHADPCCGPCNWRPVILNEIDRGAS